MKTITVVNPTKRLLSVMVNPVTSWVQTCMSDTCCHASHDAGYEEVTGEVDEEVTVKEVGGCPSSHPYTIRTDDDRGKAYEEYINAQWALNIFNTKNNQRRFSITKKVLELVKKGQALEQARIIARNLY